MTALNTKSSYSPADPSSAGLMDETLLPNPIGTIHRSIEERWVMSSSNASGWEDFCDPLTNEDRLIQAISRASGIVGLLIGLAAVGAVISMLI